MNLKDLNLPATLVELSRFYRVKEKDASFIFLLIINQYVKIVLMDLKIEKPKISLRWSSPEFHFYEKGSAWYLNFSLIALILIILFVYLGISQKQFSYYLAAAVVLAGLAALFSQSKVQPNTAEIVFNQDGIQIANLKYTWDALKTFWFSDHTINFELKKKFSFPVSATLGNLDMAQVRNFLLQYLPEKSNTDQLIFDKINQLFKL